MVGMALTPFPPAIEDNSMPMIAHDMVALIPLLVVASVLIVVLLHLVKPEIDPSWRMLSEYEIGRYGWLMRVAFVLCAVGCFLTGYQIAASGGMGGWLLMLAALGPFGAAFFATEPITVPQAERGREDRIHAAFGALFLLLFPLAATVVTVATPDDSPIAILGPWLLVLTTAVWISFVVFFGSLALLTRRGGAFRGQIYGSVGPTAST
jgi:Protein of unknown function (DUF998)